MDATQEAALERARIAAVRYREARVAEDLALEQLHGEIVRATGEGVKRADIARACGVTRQDVQEWERKAKTRAARR